MTYGLTRAVLGTHYDRLTEAENVLTDAAIELQRATDSHQRAQERYDEAKDTLDDYLHGDLVIRILNGEDLK